MRRLAVAVTITTALVVTVMVQGQGKIDPAIKPTGVGSGVQREGLGKNRRTLCGRRGGDASKPSAREGPREHRPIGRARFSKAERT